MVASASPDQALLPDAKANAPSHPAGEPFLPADIRLDIRKDSSGSAMRPLETREPDGQAEQGWQTGAPAACGAPKALPEVALDVEDLKRQAERGQQSVPVFTGEAQLKEKGVSAPPRLPKQASLPKPRSILKGTSISGSRNSSLDLNAAPAGVPNSRMWRGGSLPSAVLELSIAGAKEGGSPIGGPPTLSRLVHAASWDASTADAAHATQLPAIIAHTSDTTAAAPPSEDENARSSLLGSGPVSCAPEDALRRPLARQVSFSPAVGGTAAEEAVPWPMPSLRRSLSRALSWGRDRMNSGWSSYSNVEFCRICHTIGADEPLMDIGCDCRDGLNLAHKSCITQWFTSRGSNVCEICKTEAINIPKPPPLAPRPSRPRIVAVTSPPAPASRAAVVVGWLVIICVGLAVFGPLLAALVLALSP